MALINRKSTKKALAPQLTSEEAFWKEVEESSKNLIATLIEKVLPISAIPSVFDLEKDTDYRVLLRDDLPQSYQDNEEYQEKIARQSWTKDDVKHVSQELAVWYFDLVAKSLADWLNAYPTFENTSLAQLKEE